MINRRILYIQYTNPAGYPPLEHSSRILADRGWQVMFLGTGAHGADSLEFPSHANIEVRRWKFQHSGFRQKVHFLRFNFWVLSTAITWRPNWIYASDLLACPVGLPLKKLGFRVLYHEHDSPEKVEGRRAKVENFSNPSAFQRFLLWTRKKLARCADLCVLPNEGRAELFKQQTETSRSAVLVMNCPRREEINAIKGSSEQVILYYHGNISPKLLPETLLEALREIRTIRLLAIGYTTTGNESYPVQFRGRAGDLGVLDQIELMGPRQRTELLARARGCTIGWAAIPIDRKNFNFVTMAGASNKVFDYMACRLALLTSDLPDWKEMFVEPGYARSCNPEDSESIAAALRWFCDHLDETRIMGERGGDRVAQEWNYEKQFEPVLRRLESE
jgi:glycosyltransferase involved in cell wall biosynthesis